MCTHLHGDHVGWNTRLENGRWVPTFPNARYLFSKKEYEYWDGVHRETPLDPMRDSVLPIIDANKAELVTSDYDRRRPHPADPDSWPYTRSFRCLRRA